MHGINPKYIWYTCQYCEFPPGHLELHCRCEACRHKYEPGFTKWIDDVRSGASSVYEAAPGVYIPRDSSFYR